MKSCKKLMVLCLAAAWGSSSMLVAEAQTMSVFGASDSSKEIESINQKLNEHIEHGQAQDAIISEGVRDVVAAASDNYHSINKLHSWISEIDKLKVNHADLDGAVASINNHISSVEKNVVGLSNDVMDLDQKTNSRINTTNDRIREAAESANAANKGVDKNAVTLEEQRRAIVGVSSDAIVAKNVAARADRLSHDNRDWINQHEVESKAMRQTINQNTDLIAKKAERADLASLNNKLEEEMFDRENTEDILMNNTQVNKQAISKVKDSVSDLSDKVSDHSMEIQALKGNKAETEAALGNLKDQAFKEANTRRQNEHKLAQDTAHNAAQIASNKTALDKTNKSLVYADQKIDVNTKNVNTLNQAVTANQADISGLQDQTEEHNKSIATNTKNIGILGERTRGNEKDIADLQDQTDEHNKSIATNTKNIGILGERTRGNEKDVGELQDHADSSDKSIAKNTTAIHDNQTKIKALASDVADSLDEKLDQQDFVAFQNDQAAKHDDHAKQLVAHDARLDQAEVTVAQHDDRLDAIENTATKEAAQLADQKTAVQNNSKKIADQAQKQEQLKTEVTQNAQKIGKQGEALAKQQMQVASNQQQLVGVTRQVQTNTADIALLNSKVDYNSGRITKLDDKVNKGLALMSAMSSVDVGGVPVGKIRVAGAVGGYANKQAIAFGVGTALTNDFRLNVKASIGTEDSKSSAYSIGASYDF